MRRFALIAACLLTVSAAHGIRAAEPEAIPPTATPAEVVTEKIQLLHADPNWVMRVLIYPSLAAADAVPKPALVNPDTGKPVLGGTLTPGPAAPQRSLAPEGIQALLAFPADRSILIRGTAPAIRQFKSTLRLLDLAPKGAEDHRQYTITLQSARPELVRDVLLELGEEGKAETDGKSLKLEGSPAWVHRALRIVVRLETSDR